MWRMRTVSCNSLSLRILYKCGRSENLDDSCPYSVSQDIMKLFSFPVLMPPDREFIENMAGQPLV